MTLVLSTAVSPSRTAMQASLTLLPGPSTIYSNHKCPFSLENMGMPGPMGCPHRLLLPEPSNPKFSHHAIIRMT